MRRLPALLAALALLLLPAARASQPLPYPPGTVLSVMGLTESQRMLANLLYQPLLEGREVIDLPPGTRYDDASAAMHCLLQDYPELFHLASQFTLTYYEDTPDIALYLRPGYRVDAAAAADMRAALYDAASALMTRSRDPLALHDLLLEKVRYLHGPVWCGTAYGALVLGEANCEGYSQALTLLYRLAGVPCGVVTGHSAASDGEVTSHTWNLAYLDGPTLIDATWNDQDHLGVNTHWYYGLSTLQMAADHTPDATLLIPWCGSHANWHQTHGLQVSSREELFGQLQTFVRTGTPMNIHVTDSTLLTQLSASLDALIDEYNAWCMPEDAFYGRYACSLNPAQQCLLLCRPE